MILKLKRVLEGTGVPLKNYASLLGISEKSLYNKYFTLRMSEETSMETLESKVTTTGER